VVSHSTSVTDGQTDDNNAKNSLQHYIADVVRQKFELLKF